MRRPRTFLVLWTLAVTAATSAFVLHLGLRVRTLELGYDLGRAHDHVARLREVKRVLELELATYQTPERIDLIARSLLGMQQPAAERVISAGKQPTVEEEQVSVAEGQAP
jgi:cell division protein FtsL